jgi:hypothetical protein
LAGGPEVRFAYSEEEEIGFYREDDSGSFLGENEPGCSLSGTRQGSGLAMYLLVVLVWAVASRRR